MNWFSLLSAASIHRTNGLPRFSVSSSIGSARNIVAHPTGALFLWAKCNADCFNRKTPPVRPAASSATQRRFLLRPMKNSGIDLLRTPASGRRGKLATPPFARCRGWSIVRTTAFDDQTNRAEERNLGVQMCHMPGHWLGPAFGAAATAGATFDARRGSLRTSLRQRAISRFERRSTISDTIRLERCAQYALTACASFCQTPRFAAPAKTSDVSPTGTTLMRVSYRSFRCCRMCA